MKKRIRLKGRIRTYIQFTLYLGLLLLAIDAAVFMLDFRAGLLTFGFTIFYFAITLTLYFYNKPIIMNELISFATEYGQIQRKLLRDLELPYALLDDSGKVIWTNIAFENGIIKTFVFGVIASNNSSFVNLNSFSAFNSITFGVAPVKVVQPL